MNIQPEVSGPHTARSAVAQNTRTVLIIGGTGVFGRRLANHLAATCEARLVVTSRD